MDGRGRATDNIAIDNKEYMNTYNYERGHQSHGYVTPANGTSEAGLNFIATAKDLSYSADTIDKKIKGMQIKILDENMNEVKSGKIGQFFIKNGWSIINRKSSWVKTYTPLGKIDKRQLRSIEK